jgi:hypothetical protein
LSPSQNRPGERRTAALRILLASGLALAFCLGTYLLLEATRPSSGLFSFTFLLILPGAVSAFVVYVGDPMRRRGISFYLAVPACILGAVIVLAIVFLREGAVCVVMLAPLWFGSGVAGSLLVFGNRKPDKRHDDVFGSALLLLPLAAFVVEPSLPVPSTGATVSRSVVVQARPDQVWPLLRGIPDVQPGEGRWNVTQDIVGVPRPRGARLVGEGVGADRVAEWDHGVRFRERVTAWEPGRQIAWAFVFEDSEGWAFTDPHLRPDSRYFRVVSGGYHMEPLPSGATRVTLHTRYWIRTPVNAYGRLWGEVFLGDMENNLLALVKQRAERVG